MALTIAAASAQAMGAALATNIGSSSVLEIRSGSKPTTPETAAAGTLLVSITLATISSTGGVLTSSDPAAVSPTAAGTAGHFRFKTSGGTAVLDGTVTAVGGGGDLLLGSTTISTGVPVDLGVVTITVPVV